MSNYYRMYEACQAIEDAEDLLDYISKNEVYQMSNFKELETLYGSLAKYREFLLGLLAKKGSI